MLDNVVSLFTNFKVEGFPLWVILDRRREASRAGDLFCFITSSLDKQPVPRFALQGKKSF